jgi:sugar lactone lactonase YvrE
MHASRTSLALLASLSLACGRDRNPAPDAAADSTAPVAAAPALPDKLEGFKNPESARYDAELDVWYVSNVNGDPLAKDGNGFISRLKGDETVDSMEFIAGGRNGVTLNGPKGLALSGDTLWVADIDAVRAFDRKTGKPLTSIDLKGRAKFLNDAAAGPDGIYFTDSGFGPDAKGGMAHQGPDQIFRVSGGKAAVAIRSKGLAAPNGIAWDTAGKRFLVGPFAGKTVQAWTPGQSQLTAVAETPGQVDGVEVLGGDRVLLTSWTDSSLDVLQGGKLTPFGGKLPSPADIGVDTKRDRVAIPLLMENRVEFRAITGTP